MPTIIAKQATSTAIAIVRYSSLRSSSIIRLVQQQTFLDISCTAQSLFSILLMP
jgi:hypothetical protein